VNFPLLDAQFSNMIFAIQHPLLVMTFPLLNTQFSNISITLVF
jgi:hypothetical protein